LDTRAFLRHVLPDTGPYCIVKQIEFEGGHKAPQHFPAHTIDEAAAIASRINHEGYNTFFAVGALVKDQHWVPKLDRDKKPIFLKSGEQVYRWKTLRTAENIRGLRSYIIDLDVGFKKDGSPRGYETEDDAIAGLVAFCKWGHLPKPTVISSGNGLHVYFTLESEVPALTWKNHGESLKEMALSFGLKLDTGRTADAASVLRVVGCHNFKYDPPPLVKCLCVGTHTPNDMFHGLLRLHDNAAGLDLPGEQQVFFRSDNTGKQEKERACLDFPTLVDVCQVVRRAVDPATRDQTPEPVWHKVMMLLRLVQTPEKGRKLCHVVSKGDPRYSEEYLNAKLSDLENKNMGPSTCKTVHETMLPAQDVCADCPHWGKITSPAQLARYLPPTETLVVAVANDDGEVVEVEVPEPPEPFVRRHGRIAIQKGSTSGTTEIEFCNDMYPIRLQYDEVTKLEEEVLWRINMPHEGWVELGIPHCSKNQLATILHKRGVRVRTADIETMEWFMTAYVRKLQADTPREMTYTKQGWRKDGSFIVGDTVYRRNGDIEKHAMGTKLQNDTQHGMYVEGTLDGWRNATQIYTRPGMHRSRLYLYASLGSPLFCFTNQVATFLSATGEGGVGKSTLMEVAAAIWGDPRRLIARGSNDGSTRAAAEAMANGMNNLPIFLDEITDRDAEEMNSFILNYSGGKGKLRSQVSGGIRPDTATWSNLALVNANADEYARMASVFKDSGPSQMRLVQIEFPSTSDIVSKTEGDATKAAVFENFGHAGHLIGGYYATHATAMKAKVQKYVIEADKQTGGLSTERFWIATAASMRAAAEAAYDLGLLPNFPVEKDIEGLYELIINLREQVARNTTSPDEMLSEFLDFALPRTLTIQSKNSGNIDNVRGEPHGGLTVRHEVDTDRAYISRAIFQQYCVERHINLNRHIKALYAKGVVLHENMRKVLGAGTMFAKGNVRCIEVDLSKLQGRLHSVPSSASSAPTQMPQRKTGP